MKHRNGGAGSGRDGREEFFVMGGVDAPRHHAEKDPVLAAQAMGDDGVQIAGERLRTASASTAADRGSDLKVLK